MLFVYVMCTHRCIHHVSELEQCITTLPTKLAIFQGGMGLSVSYLGFTHFTPWGKMGFTPEYGLNYYSYYVSV